MILKYQTFTQLQVPIMLKLIWNSKKKKKKKKTNTPKKKKKNKKKKNKKKKKKKITKKDSTRKEYQIKNKESSQIPLEYRMTIGQ
jgi:FtsZ-interacting cell division protein ZipA